MKYLSAITAACLSLTACLSCLGQTPSPGTAGADSFASAQARLDAKAAAAKHPESSTDLAALRAIVANQREQIATLKGKMDRLAAVNSDMVAKDKLIESLQSTVAQLQTSLAATQSKLDVLTPSNQLTKDEKPIVSTAQLENLGERFEGKAVKMLGVSFSDASNTWVSSLPGITLSSNGLISRVDSSQMEKWIGFNGRDSSGAFFQYFFASKDTYGDLIVSLKAGQKINVSGTVLKLDHPGWYGLVCTRIEVVPVGK